MIRLTHDCFTASPTAVRERRGEDGRLPENKAPHELRIVHRQRERDIRGIGVPHEMRWRGFQFLDQRSQVGNMSAGSGLL
jgi:hypothetical protein